MARKRASMREGPLAELFRATEAAQRQAEREAVDAPQGEAAKEPQEETVEHIPVFDEPPAAPRAPEPRQPAPETVWEPQPATPTEPEEPGEAPVPPAPRVQEQPAAPTPAP